MARIAIGDVHGCADALGRLIEKLDPTEEDHLVFLGDYIDRGPDSKGVIDQCLRLARQYRCTFLRGNHEALMLSYLDEGAFELWQVNGGMTTLASYTNPYGQIDIPDDHVAFLRATELYWEDDAFFYVHAGLKPHLTIAENKAQCGERVFLWERSHFKAETLAWEKAVVCGHTPQRDPLVTGKLICLDTGCVYADRLANGRLTAMRLPERELVMIGCGC